MIGKRLDGYEIVSEIGRGRMAIVYEAYQPALRRSVAVKVLKADLARNAEFVERFKHEARAIARLEHPGIISIFDVGESEGRVYYAMQLLRGKTLEALLAESGRLPVETALSIAGQVAAALGYTHAAGILHREVKPRNIVVDSEGRAVLSDFGIDLEGADTQLTQTGLSLSDPQYMAPERIRGRHLDARSDLYSLGVVLYEMLAGAPPFRGDTGEITARKLEGHPPEVRREQRDVPPKVAAIVSRLLARQPEERYASVAELFEAMPGVVTPVGTQPLLRRAGAPRPDRRRRRAVVAVGVALAAVTAVFALLVWLYLGEGTRPARQPPAPRPQPPAPVTDPAPVAERLTVTSQPPGATLSVNGRPQGGPTPVEIQLMPGERYRLELALDGYETAGRELELADLDPTQRDGGTLHFTLEKVAPPARLVVRGPYRADVRVAGGRHRSGGDPILLPAGTHEVAIAAPSVFYFATRRLRLTAGETTEIVLPATVEVAIAANPGNCRVTIDGRDAGLLPLRLPLAIGDHDFRFEWPALGSTLELSRSVSDSTQRIFAAAPGD